jgi:peptidylprolyl isomerase
MIKAEQGSKVKVHYTGKLEEGIIFDTSENREPLEFEIGGGQVIPGFENGVVDMSVGDKKIIEIPSEMAYGPVMDELVFQVPLDKFTPDAKPEVGQKYNVTQKDGSVITVSVAAIDDVNVSLDANHPLAGKNLVFEVEIVEIN